MHPIIDEYFTLTKKFRLRSFRKIGKRHPLLIPPFTNFRLQRAVHDYLAGGYRKQRIVAKYGEIDNWDDTSNVDEYANVSQCKL